MKLPPQVTTVLRSLKKHNKPIFAGIVSLGLAALGSVAWVAADKVLAIQTQKIVYDHSVEAISGNDYTIAGGSYDSKGLIAGFRSDGSRVGVFGKPSRLDDLTATSVRTLQKLESGNAPKEGDKLAMLGNIWTSNPKEALGFEYQDLTYDGPLGKMPAWLILGSKPDVWTIGVHGIGADRTEMLRMVKAVHDAGNTMLVISYRNDTGAPRSPDNRNHLGNTEWQDVQAAVAYAEKQGATSINLYGNSIGGSVTENYLRRGNNTQSIKRVILDSPALDWENILKHRATLNGFPQFVYRPTAWMLQLRAGINIGEISTDPGEVKHPTLIIHSSDDPNVPQAPSKRLAEAQPDLVKLEDFGEGGHLRSWNNDPERYESTVRAFLTKQ